MRRVYCRSTTRCERTQKLRSYMSSSGVFGPSTGLESNTAEGSAASTDRNRLRRRAPTLTRQTTGLMIGGRLLVKVWWAK